MLLPLEDMAPCNGDPLFGLVVDLEDPCKCGTRLVVISSGKGPHSASLRCEACNRHRGWLSKTTHSAISETIKLAGRTTEPIKVQRAA